MESRLLLAGEPVLVDYVFVDEDAPGTPLTSLVVGQDYLMQAFVKDNRPDEPAGIFQAYFDVTYASTLISVNGAITHGPQYDLVPLGDASAAGFINQVGGRSRGLPNPPDGTYLLYAVPFHAAASGTLEIMAQPDETRHVEFWDSLDAVTNIGFIGNTIEIADANTPKVSIAATQNGNEAGPVSGVLTVTQSMTTLSNTVIQYTVGGTANSGSDFTPLSGTVTILAGQTTATINVPVTNDAVVEATETVVVTLNTITQGDPSVAIDQGAKQAALDILDNDTAQVRIAATTNGNETGPVAGRFTVTQTAVSSTNTVVAFTLGGSATAGSDYTSIPTTVTILAGSTTATIDVPVINDALVEGPETVVATLTGITSGDPQITLQAGSTQATLTIADNDTALVRVAKTADGSETGPTSAVFTITQTAASPANTIVNFLLSGTAVITSDYTLSVGAATIPAGMTTATITVLVLDDAIVEPNETVIIAIHAVTSDIPQVSIDPNQQTATATIADNDSALVRIAKSADGSESGPSNGRFTVTQTAASSTSTIVTYTVGGTATPGSDYTALSGTVTILAGQTSATINVPVVDDDESESTETVIVTLANVTGDPQIQVDTGQNQATVQITDDETPVVRIATTSDADEDGPVDGRWTVSQTLVTLTDTVISYTVTGSATSGADFTPLSGTVTIGAGETSARIDATILDDNLIEGIETIIVTLAEITSGDENLEIDALHGEATVEIADDETGLVGITATENGSETGPANGLFTVVQDGVAALDTIISYTVSGTATAGDDYTALGGTVTIPAGETTATILVSVMDDSLVEPDETVTITLSMIAEGSPLVAIDSQAQAAAVEIADDDTAQVGIASASDGSESGPTGGVFTIVQTAPSSTDTVIHYSIGGTATDGVDYAALDGTVTIPAGETTATIDISVVDDNVVEATETVTLTLTTLDAGGAQVTIDEGSSSATVEISDNDIALVSVVKTADGSEAGPANVVFTVSQSAPSSTDTEVQYTLAGTATAGSDYTAPSGTVIIPAGRTSQLVSIPVLDDVVLEGLETVTIVLETISGGDPEIMIDRDADSAAADITDDETGLVRIAVTTEGDEAGPTAGLFTVSQSGTTDVDTVITYTVGGTATPDQDYVALSGTLTILAGQTSATIDVSVLDDDLIEGGQTLIVTLGTITSGDERLAIDPAFAAATMTIHDDDTGLVSVAEGANASESGPASGTFIVTQSGIADVDTVVSYAVTGTAASGSDFTALTGTVTIPAGETSATIILDAIDDNVVEATETVVVTLTGITSGSELVAVDPTNDTATVEIADNDAAQVRLSATSGGNEAGATAGVFTVTQSTTSSTDTVVSYTVGGTAASGSDYTPLSGTVTIPAGQTSAVINVPVIDDAVVEGTENVVVTLSGITSGDADITIDGDQDNASLEIQDNDNATIVFASAASSVIEVVGSHTVVVRLSIAAGGTLGQSVTVNVTASGTAGAADFTLTTTSVTFAAGSSDGDEQIVSLSIADDGVLEPEETVVLTLTIGTDGTGGRVSIGGTGTHTVTIIDDPSTGVISGVVWADTNGSGGRDADEIALTGVTVRLGGVDGFGQSVERTTTTDDNGAYSFTGLANGTYDISEQQPLAFNDGAERAGTVDGSPSGQVGNDRFTGVSLGVAGRAINYNFGEWGLKAQYVNVRFFLASTPSHHFILRDTIQAAETNVQSRSAALNAVALMSPAAATPAASSAVSPVAAASASTRVVAGAATATAAQPASTAAPQAAPSANAAAAADVRVVDFLASTLASRFADAEAEMAALAFATGLSDEARSTDAPDGAAPLVAVATEVEAPPAGESASAMLPEDSALERNIVETIGDAEAANQQLTDRAFDEEESWLEELVV